MWLDGCRQAELLLKTLARGMGGYPVHYMGTFPYGIHTGHVPPLRLRCRWVFPPCPEALTWEVQWPYQQRVVGCTYVCCPQICHWVLLYD